MQKDGLHIPQDQHVCPKCKEDWFAEYDEYEAIDCPYCKTQIRFAKCCWCHQNIEVEPGEKTRQDEDGQPMCDSCFTEKHRGWM
jgi:hypothetical protein